MQAEEDYAVTKDESGAAAVESRRTRYARLALRAMWVVNLAALFGFIAWAYVDARFVQTFRTLKTEVQLFLSNGDLLFSLEPPSVRIYVLRTIAFSALTSGLALFAGLLLGPRQHRRLPSWFAFVAIVALWLGAWVNWPEIAWLGQQRRLRADIAGFETMATSLRANWPKADGERPLLGPFMAYPVGKPSVLLLLTTPETPSSQIAIAAIEHSPNGRLCFQLSGAETGAWLEWHPPGSEPASFVGGLLTDYRVERYEALAPEWFLVRYKEPSVKAAN